MMATAAASVRPPIGSMTQCSHLRAGPRSPAAAVAAAASAAAPAAADGTPRRYCPRSRIQSPKAAGGIGRPRKYPWPMSQPRDRSSDRIASDSTPSATTLTPSW